MGEQEKHSHTVSTKYIKVMVGQYFNQIHVDLMNEEVKYSYNRSSVSLWSSHAHLTLKDSKT